MRKLRTEELNRKSVEEFRTMPKLPVAVVLDNIRSGLNVGSIFRTADAFAIKHIYLCGITATPPHREILKSAIGATESVTWSHHDSIVECLSGLKREGYEIIGIEHTSTSRNIQEFDPEPGQPVALVLGNEVEGISDVTLNFLDFCFEIPQIGTKHSLNVSVCAGIALWYCFEKLLLARAERGSKT
ncbi:MAG: RNA methyltransferase [Saprospiraceae bacterium]|nr:RNA methyltransferase [Saprospiraceae bacterium]